MRVQVLLTIASLLVFAKTACADQIEIGVTRLPDADSQQQANAKKKKKPNPTDPNFYDENHVYGEVPDPSFGNQNGTGWANNSNPSSGGGGGGGMRPSQAPVMMNSGFPGSAPAPAQPTTLGSTSPSTSQAIQVPNGSALEAAAQPTGASGSMINVSQTPVPAAVQQAAGMIGGAATNAYNSGLQGAQGSSTDSGASVAGGKVVDGGTGAVFVPATK